jgi:hypothetical protein
MSDQPVSIQKEADKHLFLKKNSNPRSECSRSKYPNLRTRVHCDHCEIGGSDGVEDVDVVLLGCNAVWTCR